MFDHTTVMQLDEVLPGPALAASLTGGPGCGDADPVKVMVAWQRLDSWVQAGLNQAILAVAGKAPRDNWDDDWGREEVAAALRLPAGTAADRIDLARRLSWPLTATGHALSEGRISLRHAAEISKALQPLQDEELVLRAEAAVLGKAPGRTAAQLARIARREAIKHDPHGADERHQRARAQRRVEFSPLPDGMAELRAFLPADAATRLRAAIDRMAGRTRTAGDPRTLDQRRADALLTLAEHHVTGLRLLHSAPKAGSAPTGSPSAQPRPGAPLRVGVVAPLATLTGQANLPGDLVGYGPIPPALVRELAGAEGTRWEKWITDPGGTVTDLGRRSYRPPARLAELIRAANPTCVFPGCSQPSYRCDLDHLTRWTDGGTTTLTNLAPLCRRHHRAKDEAGWQLHRSPDGHAYQWTSPAGHEYTVPAHTWDTGLEESDQGADAMSTEWDVPLARAGIPSSGRARRVTGDPSVSGTAAAREEVPPPF